MASNGATSNLAAIVAANIRVARKAARLTQHELAVAIGRGDAMRISAWERGGNRPNDDSLLALAEVLRRDVPWFFTDHGDEKAAA